MPEIIVSLEAARAARAQQKANQASRVLGNCARGAREECGLKDPAECSVHAPYLKPDEAQ
jgi:hypothetical protein